MVTIIIPNYNGAKYFSRTLELISNLEATLLDEILVVDNGSIDNSRQVISNYANIKWVSSPVKRNKSHALNYGANIAQSKYLLFLDNDNLLVDKNIINELYSESRKINNFGCYSLSFKSSDNNFGIGGHLRNPLKIFAAKKHYFKDESELQNIHNLKVSYPQGFGFFIQRDLYLKIGGFDESIKFGGEEIDFGMKIIRENCGNYLYSKSTQKDIGIPQNESIKKDEVTHRDEFEKFIAMNWGKVYSISKNLELAHMIIYLIMLYILISVKQTKNIFKERNIRYLFANFIIYVNLTLHLNVIYNYRRRYRPLRIEEVVY